MQIKRTVEEEGHHRKRKSNPVIYLIRHGEKPKKTPDGEEPPGLSVEGVTRARALVKVFGSHSKYNIGLIIAQHPKKSGKRVRPFETIRPLADSLLPNVEVNLDIDRDDETGVAIAIQEFEGPGNVLVCWEHKQLREIVRAIGIHHVAKWPKKRFDVIWTIEPPYTKINSETSEHVPGLDDSHRKEP